MRNRYATCRWIATLGFSLALLALGSAGLADDTIFFTSQVAPNVVVVIDNSGSMNQITWHPAFRPDVVYDPSTCPYIADPDDPAYDPTCLEHPLCNISSGDGDFEDGSGNSWSPSINLADFQTEDGITVSDKCGNTRVVFNDPEVESVGATTGWQLTYLQWYFSENVEEDPDGDGNTILDDMISTTNGQRSQCAIDLGHSTTYSLYRRSRLTVAKDVIREVMCNSNQTADIRYGLAKFYGGFFSDPKGGYVTVPVDDYSSAQEIALDTAVTDIVAEAFTPLGETLYQVYRYFQSRTSGETAIGKDGSTRFPVYDIGTDGSTSSSSIPPSPVTNECQGNFVILLTDGEPTSDDFENMPPSKSEFEDDLIGDYNFPGDETEDPGDAQKTGYYLDDVAKFMQTNDFLPGTTYPGTQTIDVYTVGFTTTAIANDLLQRTADAGNGEFFSSNNAEGLEDAITEAIIQIVQKSNAFTAGTVPASRASDGNNFFSSYFNPSNSSPFWPGHLKLFEFNALGEIRDADGSCALDDPLDPARCERGRLKLELSGYWDAANKIPPAAAGGSGRKLYVSKGSMSFGSLPPEFTYTPSGSRVTASDLGISGAGSSEISAYDNGIPGFDTSAITNDEELADAIVKYIRGCEFRDGACVDRGDGNKLWDIFHSQPAVVGPPNAGHTEATYKQFVQNYKHRKRVIYAGTNGGFVHGFNAGEYGTAAVPNGYDRLSADAGMEEFGFMSYWARRNIAELPKDLPPREYYFMDGSPSAADVWFYPNATDQPEDGDAHDWHTILAGGMREGGNVVWALDVTNPPDHDDAGGEVPVSFGGPDYPAYLWEFPSETTSGDAWRPYMGETWSQPIITRVKVKVDASTENYDRWVAIFGAGYAQPGDPNLAHETVAADVGPGEYDASSESATSQAGRAIFMIDIATGEVLGAKRFQYNGTDEDPTDGEPEMLYAFPSRPAVFDLDRDGFADVVYIGDLGGNVWKWIVNAPGDDHINGSLGSDQQANWPFMRVLEAENCTSCSPKHFKSFYFPPTGAKVGAVLWLALGSGERNDLDFGQDGGLTSEQRNRMYVFKDKDPLDREPALSGLPYTDAGASTDFADVNSVVGNNPNTCLPTGSVGFYLEGEDGEKFVTDTQIFFGVVLVGSYVPPPSTASSCSSGGDAYLYGFDLQCGEGIFDPSSGSDPERRIHVGVGLPNSPRVSVGPPPPPPCPTCPPCTGPTCCTDKVIIISSDGSAHSECKFQRPDSGIYLKNWRDF